MPTSNAIFTFVEDDCKVPLNVIASIDSEKVEKFADSIVDGAEARGIDTAEFAFTVSLLQSFISEEFGLTMVHSDVMERIVGGGGAR